ncbi:NADPH-dependent oxidoreductase [Pseudomonas sp. S31]|uniref:nitroreductase family protein n=1 Tax=Pseudomonas sp. S31 TaxID=1564473 RepID=UPI001911E865|nr:nitroreductase family protein [Pseudomonas sp. S31]MBK4997953.1 NADPH-dependent oxidoreductase [Pseudomonas sp. S31]
MTELTHTHADLLQQRYGNQLKPEKIIMTPVVEAMLRHKSVRTFLPDALPEGAIETLVAAAQSASTSSALNQWSLVAVTDVALKNEIHDTVAREVKVDRIPWILEAPALLLWVADASRSAGITRDLGDEPLVLDYLDSFLMASVDASLAAQNAALAAESMGLGIVFLGVMRNIAKELATMINLPDHAFVSFGMALGRPDAERTSAIRPRPAQPVVLHYNRYNQEGYCDYVEDYEQAVSEFRTQQNMAAKTWKGALHNSMTSMQYLGGRKALHEMVVEKGFKLL